MPVGLVEVGHAATTSGPDQAEGALPSHDARPTVTVNYHASVDSAPGDSVRVVATIEAPSEVSKIEIELDDRFDVVDVQNGDRVEENTVRTTASRERITYDVPVDGSIRGSYSVRGDDWAFVDRNTIRADLTWWYNLDEEPPALRETVSVDDGYASDDLALVGNVTTKRLRDDGDGPTVTVASLDEAPPSMPAERIARVIWNTDARHEVGTGPDELQVFAIPEPYDGPYGFAVGNSVALRGSAFWDGLLVHEYVHTTQAYSTTSSMEWLVEAESVYYMTLYPAYRGTMSEREFLERLTVDDVGMRSRSLTGRGGSSFALSSTKGATVLAALDREIREATDGEKTLVDVLRRLHGDSGELTYADFRRATVNVGGEPLGEWVDRHVEGRDFPQPVTSLAALPEPGWALGENALQVCRNGEVITTAGPIEVPPNAVVTVAHSEYSDFHTTPDLDPVRGQQACPDDVAGGAPQIGFESIEVSGDATVVVTDRYGGASIERELTVVRSAPATSRQGDVDASADRSTDAAAGGSDDERDGPLQLSTPGDALSFVLNAAARLLEVLLGLRGWKLYGAVLGLLTVALVVSWPS